MPVERRADPIRVAVIGAGYFGRFHYDAWSRMPEVRLVGIVERDPTVAAALAAAHGAPLPIFTDAREMAAALAPDLVDITAPPAAHLALVEALAGSGADIVCQKPFCGGAEGARRAIAALEAGGGGRLAIHENIRFQPWHEEAARLLAAGAVGEVYQATFRMRPGDGQGPNAYLDRQPYFQSMPRFLVHETAVHWIELFRMLFGRPSGVFARLTKLNPAIAGEDAGCLLFDFESGVRALYDGNRLVDHAAVNHRLTMGEMWIEGSDGVLRLDGFGRLWRRARGAVEEVEHRFAWRDHLFGGDCVYRCNRHIFECWLAGEEPAVSARRNLELLDIVETIYASAREERYLPIH